LPGSDGECSDRRVRALLTSDEVSDAGKKLRSLLCELALRYPPELHDYVFADLERTAFHIDFVRQRMGLDITLCDVGASHSLFPAACAALGVRVVAIDMYDYMTVPRREVFTNVFDSYCVQRIKKDCVTEPIEFPESTFDVITSFDSIEHWHGSPKPALHALKRALRPGGLFFIGVPNCVNLRKRLTIPFGYGRWCSIGDWYEAPKFRSHVHEPDVDELLYIARDLELYDVAIYGRNWLGHSSRSALFRVGTFLIDHLIRMRPTLCSNIYLAGRKKAA
jgi:SAM-dependent methyltransferase